MREMTISWATQHVCACMIMYAMRMSAFSTKSMNSIVELLQSSWMTKSSVMYQRSHQDFYSVDSGGTRTQ
jgi:hypothetical protein